MPEEQIRFDNQEFLSSYIDEIIDSLYKPNGSSTPFVYKNIYKLDTSRDSLPVSIAKFTGKTESVSFNRMKSYQYASLVPKIRLFRVQGKGSAQKEYEYKFDKGAKYLASSNDSSILGSPKGQNCGIVSVEYKLAGTNPVTAERAIEVVLELYFDSINAFSGGDYDKMFDFWKTNTSFDSANPFDNQNDRTTINYWSLIMHPSNKKGSRDDYKPENYRIKAVIGWEDLGNFLQQELFSDLPKIKEDIEDTNLSMILQLTMHNFTFNEDGSIGLRIEYIASLDNIIATKKFDIFGNLKETIQKTSGFIIGDNTGTPEESKSKLKLLQYIKSNNGNLDKLKEELDTESCYKEAGLNSLSKERLKQALETFKDSQNNPEAFDALIKKQEEELKTRTDALSRAILSIKYDYYSKLQKKLFDNDNMKSLTVDAGIVEGWLNYRNNKPSSSKPTFYPTVTNSTTANNQELEQAQAKSQEQKAKAEAEVAKPDTFQNRLVNTEGLGEFLWESGKSILGTGNAPPPADDNDQTSFTNSKQLNFTTVGSIIDAVYDILLENNPTESEDINRYKVILSSFSDQTVSLNGGIVSKNIADIPISISKLSEFLLKNIEEPQKESYTLKEVLRDIMNQLVESSLNSRTYGETEENKYSNTSLAFNIFTLKGVDDPMNNFKILDAIDISTFNKSKKDIKQYYPNKKLNDGESYFNYFLMYDKYLKDFRGSGNRQEDEKLGIYHFSIGQDRGLLKKVAFKKVDQPGLREAKSLGKETLFLGQFRDRYNADLSLFGNNMFIPGMLVFIIPSVEMGNPADPNSFAELTGIGGYYTVVSVDTKISQGEYSTELNCIFHSARQSRTDKASVNKDDCTISELEKAGFVNPDGKASGIAKELKELTKVYEEQQEQERKRKEEEKAAENLQSFAGAAGL